MQEFPLTIETLLPAGDAEYIHQGQLLQKRLSFTLPEKREHKTICCQLSIRYGENQSASSRLVSIDLNEKSNDD